MEQAPEVTRRVGRRAFLGGGAAAAAGTLLGASEAVAESHEPRPGEAQVLGRVRRRGSARATEIDTDAGDPVRVDLAPGATVVTDGPRSTLEDFDVGATFIAVGEPGPDGTFTANRVIPAVLGAKQPPRVRGT